jgi:hypothetical protein
MNYLAILALSLGLLSVVITLQYIKRYKELQRDLSKAISQQQTTPKMPISITRIKDKLDMTDAEFENKLTKKEEKVIGVLKEPYAVWSKESQSGKGIAGIEAFETYYLSANQRKISDHSSAVIRSIETEPISTTVTYEDEEQMAIESIATPTPLPVGKMPYASL